MAGPFVQVGNVLSTFLGVALVVFGGYGAYWGTVSLEQAAGFGLLAVGVVAGYRSFTVRAGHWVDAAATTLLLLVGAALFFGGVTLGADALATAGQALFAIGAGYLLVRTL